MNIFTDSIKYEMQEQNLTISELAAKSGAKVSYLSKLLKGERRWNDEILAKVLNALNLEVEIRPIKHPRKKAACNG